MYMCPCVILFVNVSLLPFSSLQSLAYLFHQEEQSVVVLNTLVCLFFSLLDQKDGGGLKIGILFLGSKESILPSHNTCLKHYCFHHSREKK